MVRTLMDMQPQGGRIDTSIDDDRFILVGGRTEYPFGIFYMGDEPDGPVMMAMRLAPGPAGSPHKHNCDTITIVLEGSIEVSNRNYGPGSIRVQNAGSVYGPEIVGPEGCKMITIFANKSGIMPTYINEDHAEAHKGTLAFGQALIDEDKSALEQGSFGAAPPTPA